MREVRRRFGVPASRQMVDLIRLRLGRSHLGISDYYVFRLFDRSFTGGWCPETFVGWRWQERIAKVLNDRRWTTAAWDKLTFYALCQTFELPHPRVLAVYCEGEPRLLNRAVQTLREPGDLRSFLEAARFPLFGKPSYGQQGLAGIAMLGYDPAGQRVELRQKGWIDVSTLIEQYLSPPETVFVKPQLSYLFQETVLQHPALTELTGSTAVSGLRVAVLNVAGKREIIRAIWKVIGGENYRDNFHAGKTGNAVGSVDPRSGRVVNAIDGVWPDANLITHHAHTGRALVGFQLPHWEELRTLLFSAASAFPFMGLQYWDVALSPDGPVLLELNDLGGTIFLQLFGEGLMVPALAKALGQMP